MIKIMPTGMTNVFQLEIYAWNNQKQKWILTGNYEFCCHSEDGKFHTKDLLAKLDGQKETCKEKST